MRHAIIISAQIRVAPKPQRISRPHLCAKILLKIVVVIEYETVWSATAAIEPMLDNNGRPLKRLLNGGEPLWREHAGSVCAPAV
jgi:hypothetical protein